MSTRIHFTGALALATGAALLVGACSESPTRTGPSPITATGRTAVERLAERNRMEVCKDYSGIIGGPVTFTVQVDLSANDSIDLTLAPITLSNGQCAEVPHQIVPSEPIGDRIILTEPVLPGYTTTWTRTHTTGLSESGTGQTARGTIDIDGGWLIVFTNTSIPQQLGEGRFTGSGNVEIGDLKVSNGMTLHCDLQLSNNLEINWKDAQGNQHSFHLLDHTAAACSDDPAIQPAPPAAPIDTMVGTGTGKFDGNLGYTVQFTLKDSGEPGGSNDRIALRIFQTSNPANVVLNVPLQDITKGNLQAHFDQPHK